MAKRKATGVGDAIIEDFIKDLAAHHARLAHDVAYWQECLAAEAYLDARFPSRPQQPTIRATLQARIDTAALHIAATTEILRRLERGAPPKEAPHG